MLLYSSSLDGLYATTAHGEHVIVAGPANDPARCSVTHTHPGANEVFTPRVASLRFDAVDIMRANRLATTEQRAHAWDTLMAGVMPSDDTNLMHAAQVLCDQVTFTLNASRDTVDPARNI